MVVISYALSVIIDPSSQIYPIPFVSRSLHWLAWLGLAHLASAWLVSPAAATNSHNSRASVHINSHSAERRVYRYNMLALELWLLLWLLLTRQATRRQGSLVMWMLALELWLFLWLLLMRRATLRQGEPSQARQANQGIDSLMESDIFVMMDL